MTTPTIAALHTEVTNLHRERARLTADVAILTATVERLRPALTARVTRLEDEAAPVSLTTTERARIELAIIGADPKAARHRAELLAALGGAA